MIMRKELDDELCKKYPKIFKNRHADMQTTAMCWGFEHGDGWYNIIDVLCDNIQQHIDHTRRYRLDVLRYNRALGEAIRGDTRALIKYFTHRDSEWFRERALKQVAEVLADPEPQCRLVTEVCPQVIMTQVKEKFGTLSFYYTGGDDIIDGMVRLAESMSARVCEVCGAPGKSRNSGWIQTLCDEHAKAAGKYDEEDIEENPI